MLKVSSSVDPLDAPLAQVAADDGSNGVDDFPGIAPASEPAPVVVASASSAGEGELWPAWQLDVNGDGSVTPQDALMIANYLGNPDAALVDPGTLDIDGDRQIAAADFSAVAAYLNLSGPDDSAAKQSAISTPHRENGQEPGSEPDSDAPLSTDRSAAGLAEQSDAEGEGQGDLDSDGD